MFEYCMNEQLSKLQESLKACAVNVLVDNGYDNEKAKKAVECIKNFNVYEIESGYRVETLVEDYRIKVFHHKYETRMVTMYKKLSDKDKPISDRIQKLENRVSSFVDLYERIEKLEKQVIKIHNALDGVLDRQHHLKESINVINNKFKRISEYLKCE